MECLHIALRMHWSDLTSSVATGKYQGFRIIEETNPDLVILYDDLPDTTSASVIKEIRLFSDVPIIAVTYNTDEVKVVMALESGADGYVILPCNLMEVMARTVAIIRRAGIAYQKSQGGSIQVGNLILNPASFESYLGDMLLQLTPTEFKILYLFAKNRHVTLSSEVILHKIWNDDIETKCLKKYIQKLRSKLNDDAQNPTWIKTVYGVGYRFTPPDSYSVRSNIDELSPYSTTFPVPRLATGIMNNEADLTTLVASSA